MLVFLIINVLFRKEQSFKKVRKFLDDQSIKTKETFIKSCLKKKKGCDTIK